MTRRRQPERDLERQIFEALNLMLPENAVAFKIANEDRAGRPSPGVLKGMPDMGIIQEVQLPLGLLPSTQLVMPGRLCRIVMPEIKVKGGRVTGDQRLVMAHLRDRCNVVTGVCYTLDDVVELCRQGGIRLKGRVV